ncbi:Non-specific lipid-transfer protein 1-like protein [Drosera capensis]
MKAQVISALVILAFASVMVRPGVASVPCGQVDSALISCLPFLTHGGDPSPACCAGVGNCKTMATTTENKQDICSCIKAAAANNPGVKLEMAALLPEKCGISLDVPISPSIDCKSIK